MPESKIWQTSEGPVTIELGTVVTLNEKAAKREIAPAGSKVELYCWHYDYKSVVGMLAIDPDHHKHWNSLDDDVDQGTGWWIEIDELLLVSDIMTSGTKIVIHSHKFNGVELKGKQCRYLSPIQGTRLAFVEFDENLGGCSADGLGKRGHCIAIPTKYLGRVEAKTKEK